MRNHRFGIAAAGVIATAALAAGAAAAASSAGSATAVPFKASYAGTAVVRVDGNVEAKSRTGRDARAGRRRHVEQAHRMWIAPIGPRHHLERDFGVGNRAAHRRGHAIERAIGAAKAER